MKKVLAIFKAPAPYIDPLLRQFSNMPDIELTVAYCIKTTDGEMYYDKTVGEYVKWGVRLLDGYRYLFLDEKMCEIGKSDWKIVNPNVKELISKNGYQIILMGMGYWSLTTWIAIREARKNDIPVITRATVEAGRKRGKLLLLLKKIVVGRYCKYMAAGVYECKEQKDYLLHYGMSEESLFLAPCAVDNEFFQLQSRQFSEREVRSELGIAKDKIVLVTVGMLITRKRPMDLIKACEILQKEGYDIEVFFIGDGELRGELEEHIRKSGISGIHITGRIPQNKLGEYLTAADIYVMPSENDASPKALNEAMNFALPIVLSSGIGTAAELLIEGENGYIYKAGDVTGLSLAIKKIIESPNRDKMGIESRNIVDKFGYGRIIEGWLMAMRYAMKN